MDVCGCPYACVGCRCAPHVVLTSWRPLKGQGEKVLPAQLNLFANLFAF